MEKTYNPVMKSKLTLDFNSGTVTAQVKGGQDGCQYQYWVKKKVETYSVQGSSSYQYIWQILSDYSTSVSASIPATEIYRDENGNYNVMVRIRKDGTVIDELYGAFTYTQVGQPFITQVSIDSSAVYDEPAVIRKGSDVRITTLSNMPALPCEVFIDWSNVPLCTGTDSVARFDMVPEGLHDLKVRIGSGANSAEKIIKIYVVDNYQAEKIPVITSLEGTTVSGATTFTMRVGYADGSPITEEDISDFRYELTSGQLSGELSEAQIADGQIEVQFTMNYGQNGYGIYKTTATVKRKAKSGYDDIFITDYSGYTRSATLTLTGNSQVATGSSIQYTASGNITGLIGTIQYAFYREDASGWVLMRDYGSQGQFTWTPLRPGVYNIQARIKDSAAGSYERAATKTLTVTGSSLSGNLNVKVVSLDSGMTVEKLYAGRPYKLYAEYGGSETPLYQFTLTGENIGTVYLNAFNTDPYYIFVPQRPGEYTIFARAIHQGSFGCGDKSASVDVEVFPKTSEIAKGVDLLDFEHESQLGPITTPNDNNRVIIQRVNYGDTDVVPLQGMGDYALKLTPTVNRWPQFHIVLDRKIRALVVFDYYIESAISGEYAWNCKNPYTGQGLGELDHFENEYQNTWYRASHAFDFEADEIWLWLYLTHSDVTQVNIYIDNFRIIDLDSAHMPDVMDFEDGSHLGFLDTHDGGNAVDIEWYAYSEADIPALSGAGDYALKLTPTLNPWPEVYFLLNHTYPAGARIEFDFYIESPYEGAFAWNYKNPNIEKGMGELDEFGSDNKSWLHAAHRLPFASDEIWIWLYMDGYSDVTRVNIYIDNFRIIYDEDSFDFEQDSQLYCIDTPSDGNRVIIDRVKYSEAGITPVRDSGEYVAMFTPTQNPWPEMHFLLTKTYPAGSRIEFDYYIEGEGGIFAWNFKDPSTGAGLGELDSFSNNSNNAWYRAYHTFSFGFDEIWIWLCMYGYSDVTEVNIYIDNLRIREPAELTFEDASQMSLISTTDDDNRVIINRLTYSQAGISAPQGGGQYVARFTPTVNPFPEIHFLLSERYPAGTRIEFDYNIRGTGGIYAWNYKDAVTGAGMGEIDQFENTYNNVWYHASHTFDFEIGEIWLWLYMFGYSDITQVHIYIDNFRIIEFTDEVDFEQQTDMVYIEPLTATTG